MAGRNTKPLPNVPTDWEDSYWRKKEECDNLQLYCNEQTDVIRKYEYLIIIYLI